LPADIRAESGQEDGHVGGQAATLDVNEVTHFMDQDQGGKSKAEPGAVKSPINTEECGEAEKEFQLEDSPEQNLAFGKHDCDRSNRTQLACPLIFWLWKLGRIGLSLKFGGVTFDPIRLFGKARQEKEGFHPAVARLAQLTGVLELFCGRY